MSLTKTVQSSIGAKSVMAITGIALMLFILAHMLGNLQVFLGREQINSYAMHLQNLGPLLWVMRIGLFAVFVLHIGSALKVVRDSRAARPIDYVMKKDIATTYAAKTMFLSGLIVLAFLIFHLLHFTYGVYDPAHAYAGVDSAGHHDVYGMVVASFRHAPTAIVYILAQLLLGLHLSHGASSLFQTLGLRKTGRSASRADTFGKIFAGLIVVGNVSIPLFVLAGIVG